jgi:Phosphotransferase enzyme family
MTEPLTPQELGDALAGPVGEALISTARVGSIEPLGPDKPVADQTYKYLVKSSEGEAVAVVLCSPGVAPDLVARGSRCASQAKRALGTGLGKVVLEPIDQGEVRGLSYVVLPYCQPLSDRRLVGWLERRRLRPMVLNWLLGLTRQTMRDVSEADRHARFNRPLDRLAQAVGASDAVRQAAVRGLNRLERGKWTPRFVLMHNDLWKGNILLDGRGGFVVIDWPGSTVDGYAVYDLVRLADSFRLGGRALGEQVRAHCRVLGCEPRDAVSHLAAGLGHLLLNLEHFPMHRFMPLADGCIRRTLSALERMR